MPPRGEVRVGTSGYVYEHWWGAFYPEDLPAKDRFAHYAARFDTVEVNHTFYRMPTEAVVRRWADAAPEGFRFCFKASRYITHMKRLLPSDKYGDVVQNLLDRLRPVRERGMMGPLLFQLPPRMRLDLPRLRGFLQRLPHPDDVRYAFEFRHASWYTEDVLALLGEHGVAFCIHDWVDAPTPIETTADHAYVRFHGHRAPYQDLYGPHRLAPWAKRIEAWRRQGRDVHVYFNNDQAAYAVRDARWLAARLGVAKEAAVGWDGRSRAEGEGRAAVQSPPTARTSRGLRRPNADSQE